MILPRVVLAVLSVHAIFADAINIFHRVSDSRLEPQRQARVIMADEKYFHEPGGSELGNHYDSRYFGGIQTYEEKQDTQIHMIRAYLTFFAEKGVETWLAHGTLLGWWWNGKVCYHGLCNAVSSNMARCFRGIGILILKYPGPR